MRGFLPGLGAVLLAGLAVGTASAQNYPGCLPPAPNGCGAGYCAPSESWGNYGPDLSSACPGVPPVSGVPPFSVPLPGHASWFGSLFHHQRGFATFATHPYARSPRDYFMVDDP
jgi:hypothetical protein